MPSAPHPALRAKCLPWLAVVLWMAVPGCGGEDPPTPPGVSCDDPGDICTVMGTGEKAYKGEGASPDQVALYYPIDLAFDAQGRLLVLDWNNLRVRRLDADGRVRTILGTGYESESVIDGVPALDTSLHHAFSMQFDAAGTLYLAAFHVPYLIRVTDDLVYVVAGSGDWGYTGDGGPALQAALRSPCGIAVHPDGYPIYFADTENHAIRVIAADGTVNTLAGDGTEGYTGDGGPAAGARFRLPYRIRLDSSATVLYVADTENHAVRAIDLVGGTIETVAGTGEPGFDGDGGPAALAHLNTPLDAREGPDGSLYIADARNNRVRRVNPDGTIVTVAGTGTAGWSGDGGPPTEARLDYPAAINFDQEGTLWIADTYNSLVRKVTPPY